MANIQSIKDPGLSFFWHFIFLIIANAITITFAHEHDLNLLLCIIISLPTVFWVFILVHRLNVAGGSVSDAAVLGSLAGLISPGFLFYVDSHDPANIALLSATIGLSMLLAVLLRTHALKKHPWEKSYFWPIFKDGAQKDLKDFFKPTFSKVIVPVLLSLFLLYVVITAMMIVSSSEETQCEIYKTLGDLTAIQKQMSEDGRYEWNANPESVIENRERLYKSSQPSWEKFNNLSRKRSSEISGQERLIAELAFSGSSDLIPLFPTPCDVESPDSYCYSYMSPKLTECLSSYIPNQDFGKPLNFFPIAASVIATLIVYYLLSCLIVTSNRLISKGFIDKVYLIFVAALAVLVFALPILHNGLMPLLVLAGLALYLVFAFIPQESIRKYFLIAVMVISVGVTLALFMQQAAELKASRAVQPPSPSERFYEAVNCTEYKNLTVSEMSVARIPEQYWNETWQVCKESCLDTCQASCKSHSERSVESWSGFPLRGDHPTCVCYCSFRGQQIVR